MTYFGIAICLISKYSLTIKNRYEYLQKLVRQDCSSYWEWKVYKKKNYNPIEWTRSKCCCVF